jgi:hypothetical protein
MLKSYESDIIVMDISDEKLKDLENPENIGIISRRSVRIKR